MSHEKLPKAVQEAKERDDKKALSRMGHKGGVHAGIKNALKAEERENERKELIREQAELYTLTSDRLDGDVLPPDPNTLTSFEE